MLRRLAAVILGVASIACGGGSTAPADETPYDYEFADPAGDTAVATANPDSLKAIDLVKVSGRVDRNTLTVALEFAEPVVRWTAAAPNSLDGFIDLDPSITGALETQTGYYLDLRDDGFGKAGLVSAKTRTVTLVKIRFDGTRVDVEIPRAAISSTADADNQFQMLVTVGARRRRPTDLSPNTGAHTLKPPAP